MEFVLGQRWVSQTESELGLGVVVDLEGRHITVRFPAADEDRVYAQNNCPLARVIYQPGETIHDLEQTPFVVREVEDIDGLKCYFVASESGAEAMLPETQISGQIQLSSPNQRLLSGQFDRAGEYELRVAALGHRHALQQSDARGLLGVRTSLLSHQISIAADVAARFAPRVLLADEVGLGKTIEAGMIVHRQLQTGLASRVLIVVPDALLHQWLVEMLRKFNLHFALFDKERFDASIESGEPNPFETEQLVLCGLPLLVEDAQVAEAAVQAGWDLMVVDEAHHLHWNASQVIDGDAVQAESKVASQEAVASGELEDSEEVEASDETIDSEAPDSLQEPSSSASQGYDTVERLAQECRGLLLLTATPEQLGVEGHFARLRLLDPARFLDFEAFRREQAGYKGLNQVVQRLLSDTPLDSAQQALLTETIGDEIGTLSNAEVIERLLDRHGTGRVLFRNTRAAIEGFPQRMLHAYPLSLDDELAEHYSPSELYPEQAVASNAWLDIDPRVSWLETFFKSHPREKVLLICASAKTAVDLEHHLHLNVGIRSAAFYEGLSIVERDRAAAYFAEEEGGAQTLICSEIGSEGRNFQFAHHLVLFDLPANPDLLEQRIGRLDRIGQVHDIQIHVPYLSGGAHEVLYRWYHEGLDAFETSFSAGSSILETFADSLHACFEHVEAGKLEELLESTKVRVHAVKQELQEGRDQLLELNSCRTDFAQAVIDEIEGIEDSASLDQFMAQAFDTFGIEQEVHSEAAFVLRQGEQVVSDAMPPFPEEGMTVTFDRECALAREDIEFLSWEAPFVSELLETLLGSELGNTAINTIALKAIPQGTLLLEAYFVVHCIAPKTIQVPRYLPATPIRLLLDSTGRELSSAINHEQLSGLCQKISKSKRPAILKEIRPTLEKMLQQVEQQANKQLAPLQEQARDRVKSLLGEEVERMHYLRSVNPAVRDEEVSFFEAQRAQVLSAIDDATLEPQAARIVITI